MTDNSIEISKPLVSIVIPSFNKADLLIEMIEGIINQSYRNWELIIVDDGSDDCEFEKVHSFVSSDNRITHIRRNREPKNGDTCRNIGMEMAKGEYLIIFDADDIISPTCLEKRVEFIQNHPEYDYVSFPYSMFNHGEKWPFKDVQKILNVMPEGHYLSSFLRNNYPFTVWSNIYRMDAVRNIKWDEKVFVYQDFDFMISCLYAGLKHGFSDGEPDYFYRQFVDGRNVSGSFVSSKKTESSIYLFSKILDGLSTSERYEQYKSDYFYFVVLQYLRLLVGGNKENVDKFITFVKDYYGKTTRFRMTSPLVKLKDGRLKNLIVHYVIGLVFGRKDYLKTANFLLSHRIKKTFSL